MKMVVAIIKPFKLDDVRAALAEVGIQGITVTRGQSFGRQKGHTELYRGAEYVVDFLPKVKLELAVDDDQVDEWLKRSLRPRGRVKSVTGKIFVSDLGQAVRIRTGESGSRAPLGKAISEDWTMKRLLLFAALLAWTGMAFCRRLQVGGCAGQASVRRSPARWCTCRSGRTAGGATLPTTRREHRRLRLKRRLRPESRRRSPKDAEDKKAIDQDVAQIKVKQCADAQDRYKKLIEGRHIYKTGPDGERQFMTSEEIDTERMNAKRDNRQHFAIARTKRIARPERFRAYFIVLAAALPGRAGCLFAVEGAKP